MFFRKQPAGKDVYIYNLRVNMHGLTSEEAAQRLKIYGQNLLQERKKKSPVVIFLSQFNDFMIWTLFAAAVVSAVMGEKADSITIVAIVIINGILGFVQEYKTEKSMEALKELTAPVAKVIRDGVLTTVTAREIVPDDLIVIEAGDRVPADSMLVEAFNIQVDESLLTGESAPVYKKCIEAVENESALGQSENSIYMGTIVTGGRGKAIVTSTGMVTEMGKIADILQDVHETMTPLQKRLDKMGRIMVYFCVLICALVTVIGIFKGENAYTMFLTGVSLAVAAIPEGLPAIVTVSLALGVQRMLKRNALIRRLPAVETLGCTSVICSDKTGTLTENKMTIKNIYCDGSTIDVSGSGYELEGDFSRNGRRINLNSSGIINFMLEASISCTDSGIEVEKTGLRQLRLRHSPIEVISTTGDPTEVALLVCGYKAGLTKTVIDEKYRRVDEIPFDSNRKRMSVITRYGNEYYVFVKGAIDTTIELCSFTQYSGEIRNMNPILKNTILDANDRMAKKALRVLAIAYKKIPRLPSDININTIESNLVFLGLVGMIDPPRPEAIDAINVCKIAGIKPVMITGDHRETAIAIARELKLVEKGDKGITGRELDCMDDRTLDNVVKNTSVFARVSPKHKLRIVKAFKNNGFIVAMTGDGVNDAPAVKEADIGISMGKTGTDVTKEASSMVLLDDNFATIVAAVEEGRIIYDNIRKFIRYLLSCNLGEVLTMLLSSMVGLKIPLIPIQILWVNLVTDGLPAVALGVDPPDTGIMERLPRKKDESIFSDGLAFKIIFRGILIGICTLTIFAAALYITSGNLDKARTMAFATLIMSQLIHVFECRSERRSIFEINPFTNMYLLISVLVSTIMLMIAIYVPPLQPVFSTVSLDAGDWVEVLFFSGAIALISNLRTYIKHSR